MIFTVVIYTLMMCTSLMVIEVESKVILIIPRQVRRAPVSGSPGPWRNFLRHPYIKATNFLDNEFLPTQSHARPYLSHHYRPPKNRPTSYNKNLPQGGNDFDHSHEEVNHILVPHGKEITHGLTFGKGYVPHDVLMQHSAFQSTPNHHHDNNEVSASYTPEGAVYSPHQITQLIDSYYQSNENSQHQIEGQERRADELALKLMSIKSINKPENNYNNEKSLIAPRAVSQLTLGVNKPQIILQDTLGLDDYNKQILELTNTWPKPIHSPAAGVLSTGISSDSISQFGSGSQSLISQPVNLNNFHGSSGFTPGYNIINPSQQQGYSVKEDIQDIPHDFRTMPIQTTSVQAAHQQQSSIIVPSSQSNNFGHQQSYNRGISASPQSVAGYYALTGLTGISRS